ncbi:MULTISPECIES: transposase [unclassified Pseudoalteromonas]|jgi:transposase-like protein|uniref:transposase n=1 Tax=unclassified Pseudoalteromonas TaxID=194690 RepID=UPI00110BBB9C|nr:MULTISPECIES: transposase [unclassified Pseudoalteromonas]MDC9511226.1 transposase [Pseudoalteromonas sp. Angola-4]TMP70776.1 hypothetical protein CWB76_09425 [Pseudoalteromonas sp. S1609]|tara:strand:+ start:633 stop:896 length:264 start_codon:yes stop_codon:yes gene_type:complete
MTNTSRVNIKLHELIETGAPIIEVASEIGVSTKQLKAWIAQVHKESFDTNKNKFILMKVEEHLQHTLREREVLLKAVKIFAREMKDI